MVRDSHQDRVKNSFADPRPYLQNNPYVDLRADAVRRLLPRHTGMSLLDLGCGDGRISIPLAEDSDQLLLVDSSAAMLDLARTSVPQPTAHKVRYQCVDLADFQAPHKYDVVLCIGVLAHVPDPIATLRQIAGFVAPGGYALVQLTDEAFRLGRLTHYVGDLRRRFVGANEYRLNHMTLGLVCTALQNMGLELTSSYRYIFVPGLRRLPATFTRAVVRSVNGSMLARLGGEVLALFRRV